MTDDDLTAALTRAWQRTNDARRRGKKWEERAAALRKERDDARTALAAADALVEAAIELPAVVKTKALRAALSKYRKARGM